MKTSPPRTLTSAEQLAAAGLISGARTASIKQIAVQYPIAVTPAIAALINPTDPDDPIARQFVPSEAEFAAAPGQTGDPIGDERHSPVKGVVHRYPNRTLFKVTMVCPVYCRFCFRREMVGPGAGQTLTPTEIDAAIAYFGGHSEIREVIFTGGDPLMLSPRRLKELTRRIAAIPHIDVLRWHSRVPVVDPARVTQNLVSALRSPKAVYCVVHVNHPRELSEAAIAAVARFIDVGISVLSQTVLLKGVNDDLATLQSLMQSLIAARIKPYYLHHMDLARGTNHFRTTLAQGQTLVAKLRHAVSGIAFPQYVLDIPGGYAKAQLGQSDADMDGATVRIRDAEGDWHDYPEDR